MAERAELDGELDDDEEEHRASDTQCCADISGCPERGKEQEHGRRVKTLSLR